jgi:hypothetical protein
MANSQMSAIIGAAISKGAKKGIVLTAQLASGETVPVFINMTVANTMLASVLVHTKSKVSDALLQAALIGSEVAITLKQAGEEYHDKDGNVLGEHESDYYTVELADARPVECDNLLTVLDFASSYLAKQSSAQLTALSATKVLKDNKQDYDMLRDMGLIDNPQAFMSLLMKVAVTHFRSELFDLDVTTPKAGNTTTTTGATDAMTLFVNEAKLIRTTAGAAEQQTIDVMLSELLNGTKTLAECEAIMATL